jgi:hypothetical protein
MSESLESVMAKIQKLSAMAAGGTEHEASNAASLMQALLAKHNLDMATVEANAPVKSGPAARVKETSNSAAMYKFQRDLMARVADNNFCKTFIVDRKVPHERKKGEYRTVKRFQLLGSKVNVTVALHMYEYLSQTMDRLLPYTGMEKRGKNALLWLEGCGDRLGTRLWRQKQDALNAAHREAEERKARQPHPSAAPEANALTLVDVYSSEDDLNYDAVHGLELGTTARSRLEAKARLAARSSTELAAQEAKWKEQDARWEAEKAAKLAAETPAAKAKREAREKREQEKADARFNRQWQKDHARQSSEAYRAGHRTADQIGLDTQVGNTKQESIG